MDPSKLSAEKMARYFAEEDTGTILDIQVICALLRHPESSPTDLQEIINGSRRGGSVDQSLSRLQKQGLISITVPDDYTPTHRRSVDWTADGKKWLRSMSR